MVPDEPYEEGYLDSAITYGKEALTGLAMIGAVAGGASLTGGCTSLQQSHDVQEQRNEPMLDMTACEGSLYSTGDSDFSNISYEIREGVDFHGARAMEVETTVMMGGVGVDITFMDVYRQSDVNVLGFLYENRGEESLERRIQDIQADAVEIDINAGPFSLPTGTYDLTPRNRIARQIYQVEPLDDTGQRPNPGDIAQQAQFQQIYKNVMEDAAQREANGSCD